MHSYTSHFIEHKIYILNLFPKNFSYTSCVYEKLITKNFLFSYTWEVYIQLHIYFSHIVFSIRKNNYSFLPLVRSNQEKLLVYYLSILNNCFPVYFSCIHNLSPIIFFSYVYLSLTYFTILFEIHLLFFIDAYLCY